MLARATLDISSIFNLVVGKFLSLSSTGKLDIKPAANPTSKSDASLRSSI